MEEFAISLQDVVERFKLSDKLLDESPSEEYLRKASKIIDDHETLGPELGLTTAEMTAISSEKTVEYQRSVMLKKWKQKLAWKATYRKLIEALLKCSRADLAQKMCELLAQGAPSEQPSATAALPPSLQSDYGAPSTDGKQRGVQSTASSLPTTPESLTSDEDGDQLQKSSSPAPPAPSVSREEQPPGQVVDDPEVTQPDLGQVKDEMDTSQLQHMEKKFKDLLTAASGDLERRKVPIRKINRSLFVCLASDTQTDNGLVTGHRHEIREADTVEDLFENLLTKKSWSFLNPGLLMRIIDIHCSESVDAQKVEYLEKLQQFRKATTAREFTKVYTVSTPSPTFSEVVFEMEKDWDNATLEKVENLKQEMHKQGYLNDHIFNFQQSKHSPISLVWAIPCGCPINTTILRIPPSFYLEHGIRRVLVKGACVIDLKFEEEQEEVGAKQPHVQLKLLLRKAIEEVTSSDTEKEELKATREKNEKLTAALEEAETAQQKVQKEKSDLEDKVRKYEIQMKTAGPTERGVSDALLLHAMEQEKVLKRKDMEIADCQNKITRLTKEVDTLKKQTESILMMQHEEKEGQLLQLLKIMKGVEGRKPTQPTGDYYVESRGIRYHVKQGDANGNTKEMMILVSVGSEFPAGVRVQPRVRNPDLAEKAIQTHGRLPPIVTGLHEEAAADLMATVSVRLESPNGDLVRLCLDVPGKQRSKKYYLKTIEEYFKRCQQPLAVLIYLGHSEEGTGNWCFKDGTISFQEVFDLYRKHRPGKRLTIHSDCCYSGNWVRECAKTLDSLGIPPCGHKAREQGILIKMFASCQKDQVAVEPCYSLEGVTVNVDGTLGHYYWKKGGEKQSFCGTDFTQLVCCRGPDESCRSEKVLKNWTWQDAMNGGLKSRLFIVRGKDRGRPTWHYVLLSNKSEAYKEQFSKQLKSGTVHVAEWGYVIESGWGQDPPDDLKEKITNWMDV